MNTPKMPEFRATKNGYEIRTEILDMARHFVTKDFEAKFAGWEITLERSSSGQVLQTVSMPEFPGLEKILETAEKMYAFVNQSTTAKK